jgi:hypothetical protein
MIRLIPSPSWPGVSGPSLAARAGMDGPDKPGHDDGAASHDDGAASHDDGAAGYDGSGK